MINIKELSIGNYLRVAHEGLCIKKGTIIKINGIDAENKFMKKGLVGAIACHPLDEDQLDGGIWLAYLEPIEITPEILEKNGFYEDGDGVYGDDNSYFIPIYSSGFDTGTWETHIEPTEGIGDFYGELKYVHQLQNALTLCGINKEIEL